MIKNIFSFTIILFISGFIISATCQAAEMADKQPALPISIYVSIGAHLDFCQQIGAERVSVNLALAPGKSPATYAPSPREVQLLSQARLYFKVGLPFETALLAKLKALPHTPKIIDTQAGITLHPMQSNSPGFGHAHRHLGLDPHTWLDPKLALRQATTIYTTLSRIDPDGKNIYTNNYNILKDKLQSLDNALKSSFAPFANRTIFVYHPAFGYFARAFGLHQVSIEIAGKKPKARELANFIKTARAEKIAALFVQPQFDQQSADKVAQVVGCAVVRIDPLATKYCQNLKFIAASVQKTFRQNKRSGRRE